MRVIAGHPKGEVREGDEERACSFCGTACLIGKSQAELMDLLGEESFKVVGDCCLSDVVKRAGHVDVQASDEVVERVKGSVGEGHSEDSDG